MYVHSIHVVILLLAGVSIVLPVGYMGLHDCIPPEVVMWQVSPGGLYAKLQPPFFGH